MEHVPPHTQTEKSNPHGQSEYIPAVFTKRFNQSEITDSEWEQISCAERNGYIRASRAGPFLYVDFLPIRNSEKLPPSLFHIADAKDADSIRTHGLRSNKGRIYLQDDVFVVEPEGASLSQSPKSLVCVEVKTQDLLNVGKTIILDPESIKGYVGEFMHAFVVYGNITPQLIVSVRAYEPPKSSLSAHLPAKRSNS